ncbi:hypothetical protein BHE74_00059343 [Ensete ventricosum]|nr:hypothetical protein GW17_00038569 [Ensete ventricosum]RWW35692.1 hypothetical protein BHE74_00059343 [Ensete ventricosum]
MWIPLERSWLTSFILSIRIWKTGIYDLPRSLIARPQGQPHGRSQERPTAGVVPTQGDIARPEGLSPEATVPTHRQGQQQRRRSEGND